MSPEERSRPSALVDSWASSHSTGPLGRVFALPSRMLRMDAFSMPHGLLVRGPHSPRAADLAAARLGSWGLHDELGGWCDFHVPLKPSPGSQLCKDSGSRKEASHPPPTPTPLVRGSWDGGGGQERKSQKPTGKGERSQRITTVEHRHDPFSVRADRMRRQAETRVLFTPA